MSLSTQLARGTLALPLLAVFGLLALSSQFQTSIEPVTLAQPEVSARLCMVGTPREHALLLAQAPADLGPMTKRWRQACRA